MLPDRSFSELYTDTDSPDPVTHTRVRKVGVERRASPRVALETDVVVATEAQFFSGISVDLSPGGVFVATHRLLEVGALVSLELGLAGGQVLARGVVRWARRADDGVVPGLGIAFEGLSVVDRDVIGRSCAGSDAHFYTRDAAREASGTN